MAVYQCNSAKMTIILNEFFKPKLRSFDWNDSLLGIIKKFEEKNVLLLFCIESENVYLTEDAKLTENVNVETFEERKFIFN